MIQENHPEFLTATIYKWKHIFKERQCKLIILESLRFLVLNKRVNVYAFVIMPNHIHLVWQILSPHKREHVQRDFLKYTAQQIKFYLQTKRNSLLQELKVELKDREYHIWQRSSLSIALWTQEVIEQKIDYIHYNPCQQKWNLSSAPESYLYSSAKFYILNENTFDFLTHYMD